MTVLQKHKLNPGNVRKITKKLYKAQLSKPFDFIMKSLILRTITIKTRSQRSFTHFMFAVIDQQFVASSDPRS